MASPIIPVLRRMTRGQCVECIAHRARIPQDVAVLQIAALGRSVLISTRTASWCVVCGMEGTTYRLA
jgi:hypothetical protein